ncbi:MAG: UDP-3-O-acyl-N-acetylglucosamine deacetylase [Phycisphaeraceae bacterium]
MDVQRTISQETTITGKGLFTGQSVKVTFRPAPDNHGIIFVRVDKQGAQVPALIGYVERRARRTALRNGPAVVETTEHVMSALAGLGIDNLLIELDASELPGLDGSALPYVQALQSAGLKEGVEPRRTLVLNEPIVIKRDGAMIAAVPAQEPGLSLLYELDYAAHPAIGRQLGSFTLASADDYVQQIAPARTFVLEEEAKALHAAGLGTHLTTRDVLVFDKSGPIDNSQRFADEPVRHKILDLIGDLYLMGAPIQARIVAARSGHALNQALTRELVKRHREQTHQAMALHRNVIDIRKLARILPHRYPMLLVDRVLEIDGERRALGIKNVTVNEPFFQGHYPTVPIMPGVLIVEAMAQLSGVLIGQRLENQGKLAILMSLDRVKLRRPVVPGDQLILEAETARLRPSIAHMRCRAYVGQDLAAEAEIKFMIVSDQQM